MSVSHAWKEMIALWQRDGRLLAIIALAFFALPGTLLATVVPTPQAMESSGGLLLVLLLLILGASLTGQVAIARLVLAPGVSVGDALRHGARRVPALFGALMLAMFGQALLLTTVMGRAQAGGGAPSGGLALLAFALLVALVYAAMRMMVSVAVAAVEPGASPQIVRRSFALSRGHGGRLAAVLFFAIAAMLLVMAVFELVAGTFVLLLLGPPTPLSLSALLIGLATQIPQALVAAGFVSFVALLYRQLSAR